jgi:hypothetical protein
MRIEVAGQPFPYHACESGWHLGFLRYLRNNGRTLAGALVCCWAHAACAAGAAGAPTCASLSPFLFSLCALARPALCELLTVCLSPGADKEYHPLGPLSRAQGANAVPWRGAHAGGALHPEAGKQHQRPPWPCRRNDLSRRCAPPVALAAIASLSLSPPFPPIFMLLSQGSRSLAWRCHLASLPRSTFTWTTAK